MKFVPAVKRRAERREGKKDNESLELRGDGSEGVGGGVWVRVTSPEETSLCAVVFQIASTRDL